MSNIAGRILNAETNCELLDVIKDLEAYAKDTPERAVGFSHLLSGLFCNSSTLVRKGAFNSAVAVISASPATSGDLIAAYRCAILSPDREVSRHAISYLPQFVSVSIEHANSLVKAALEAVTRHPGSNDVHIHISQVMDVIKNIGIPKTNSK